MNVLLINPSSAEVYGRLKTPAQPSLGLAYLCAAVREHQHQCRVVEMDAEQVSLGELVAIAVAAKPDLIGISATTPTYGNSVIIAAELRKQVAAPIAIGGMHATLLAEKLLAQAPSPPFDLVVVGEGEDTLVDLLAALGGSKPLAEVPGLIYREANRVMVNPPRPPIADLDRLPFPARDGMAHRKYAYPDSLRHPVYPIITSRGCPGKCTFCTAHFLHGRRFRFRSAEKVLDEIALLVREHGAREIHIWDDNFIAHRKRVFAIRDGIRERGIKVAFAFPNGVRADCISPEILLALKEMGTYSIAIGVESGNQGILDRINKGITKDQMRIAFRAAQALGLETWGFFLIGLPGEDATTITETIDFALELDPDVAKFHILKPYPGSQVHAELQGLGLITDTNLVHYGIHTDPVHCLPTVSAAELLTWQKRAYRRFYLRPKVFWRAACRQKSLHRIKLNLATGLTLLREKIC